MCYKHVKTFVMSLLSCVTFSYFITFFNHIKHFKYIELCLNYISLQQV